MTNIPSNNFCRLHTPFSKILYCVTQAIIIIIIVFLTSFNWLVSQRLTTAVLKLKPPARNERFYLSIQPLEKFASSNLESRDIRFSWQRVCYCLSMSGLNMETVRAIDLLFQHLISQKQISKEVAVFFKNSDFYWCHVKFRSMYLSISIDTK